MLIALVLDLNSSDSNPAAKAHDKTFLDHMKAIKRWEDAAKALVVAHQVIINEAAGFAKELLALRCKIYWIYQIIKTSSVSETLINFCITSCSL